MLKVVVFDGGYGGEKFADLLEEELPIVEVIRVIDWRHAEEIIKSAKTARIAAMEALRPYINKVDLIVFANHLLSLTSLSFFRQKYRQQKFVGLELKHPDTFVDRELMVLTTSAVTRSLKYHKFIHQLKRKVTTVTIDSWPSKIDDGELTLDEIKLIFNKYVSFKGFSPNGIIMGCAQLEDIKEDLMKVFGKKIKLHSSFEDGLREVCKTLKIRGGAKKK